MSHNQMKNSFYFQKYFLGLNPENNQRNPWFVGEKQKITINSSEMEVASLNRMAVPNKTIGSTIDFLEHLNNLKELFMDDSRERCDCARLDSTNCTILL